MGEPRDADVCRAEYTSATGKTALSAQDLHLERAAVRDSMSACREQGRLCRGTASCTLGGVWFGLPAHLWSPSIRQRLRAALPRVRDVSFVRKLLKEAPPWRRNCS